MNANDAVYIEVSAEVMYWEDATINGVDDERGDLVPCRNGKLWEPTIRLADGVVMEWPAGIVAGITYKVCDQGEYWLLDAERKRIAKWRGDYVPDDILCPGESGLGDYIIFNVGGGGEITPWAKPDIDDSEWRTA